MSDLNQSYCKVDNCDRKVKARGLCAGCYEKDLRKRNPGYRLRQIENTKRWRQENPKKAKLADQRKRTPEYRKKKNQRQRKRTWERWNFTEEEYKALCASGCSICGSTKRMHIDHDHKTGLYRGMLCGKCNNAIGLFNDNKELLANAIKYLDDYEQRFNEIQSREN
jgi:hypothetical protein